MEPVISHPQERFNQRFEQELARGDARRVAVTAVLLLVAAVTAPTSLVVLRFLGSDAQGAPVPVLTAALLVFAAVEGAVWWHLRARARRGVPVTVLGSVGAMVMEMVGTLAVVQLIASSGEPLGAFNGPVGLLIAMLLLASILRLEPRVPLVGGLVAMVGYLALTAAWWPELSSLATESVLTRDVGIYFLRAFGFATCGAAAALVAHEIRARVANTLKVTEERRRVLDLFSQQVSPEVVDKLLSQEQALASETRSVCVMFLDIRGFTRFSESRTPPEVVDYLNTVFDRFIAVVNSHHGVINSFMGDGFMALFGAPVSDGRDARNAVAASLELLDAVAALETSGAIPPTRVGIGLHLGDVVVGNVGSRQRRSYTAIGDPVNTASRIEGLNKALGSQVLLSGAVRAAAPVLCADAEAVAPMEIRGKAQPLEIWRLR